MKTHDVTAVSNMVQMAGADPVQRLVALERLIVYARGEAEKLQADVLVFCLDASLNVARTELEGQKAVVDTAMKPPRRKLRH